jgi:quinol monooxygenase YgiN
MDKYGLQGALKALPGKGKELADILLEASKLVSNATGCYIYLVAHDAENRDIIRITEVWDTKENHDDSLKIPDVRKLISKAIPLLDGPPLKGIQTEVIGGKGI